MDVDVDVVDGLYEVGSIVVMVASEPCAADQHDIGRHLAGRLKPTAEPAVNLSRAPRRAEAGAVRMGRG
jgi:hypothetical protein